MQDLNSALLQLVWEDEVVPKGTLRCVVKEIREIPRQGSEFSLVLIAADQQILAVVVQLRKVQDEIANVGTNAEIVEFANIECNSHSGVVSPSPAALSAVSNFSRVSFSGKLNSPKASTGFPLSTRCMKSIQMGKAARAPVSPFPRDRFLS